MMRPEEVRTIWGDSKIEALTEYTVTDLDELFIILEEARENGYALDNEENETAFAALPPRSWIQRQAKICFQYLWPDRPHDR